MQERQDPRWTAVTAVASVVGLGALVAPSQALRALGSRPALDGRGDLGWRLFGARNLAVAAGLVRGDRSAQVAAVALQVPDQAAFVAAYRSGELERRTFVLAMVLSAAIVGLGGSALASTAGRDDGWNGSSPGSPPIRSRRFPSRLTGSSVSSVGSAEVIDRGRARTIRRPAMS